MIQRIQTLFLAVALIMMGLLLWLPLGEITANEKIYSFSLSGVTDSITGQSTYQAWYLMALIGFILMFQVVIIFSYKKRVGQVRMATLNILLMLVFVLVCWLFVKTSAKSLGESIYSLKVFMAFPLIAVILNYLAIRAIRNDEALVRSVDRIR
jgi:glucan phosphoethanolaminetransferase (alkaline phosphatase superfamily)